MTIRPMFVDKQEAARILSLSESTFEELIRKNEFPKARRLSSRRVGWLVREVEEWAESRPVAELFRRPTLAAAKENLKRLQPLRQQRKPVPALRVVAMKVVRPNDIYRHVAQDRLSNFVRTADGCQ